MQITLETLRNKESRDALIDDLIRMMVDGHIVTVLDFIPVRERLPEDEQICFVMDHSGDIDTDFFEMIERSGWCEELNDKVIYWTHWAARSRR